MRFTRSRKSRERQLLMPFLARRKRLERRFRLAITATTLITIGLLFSVLPAGREFSAWVLTSCRTVGERLLGISPSRAEIASIIARKRAKDIASTQAVFREIYNESRPEMRRLLDYCALTPEQAVLRTGNFDKVLLLPGTVFEVDDAGRAYRMKPNVRSVWLRNVALPRSLAGFFLVPDRPDLRTMLEGTGAYIVPDSEQSTNSWGCRGPEPDLAAPLKGLILGDSNMQGLFVGDSDTPPACLARHLEKRLNKHVSLLNTGHLGYSPEQYWHTLEEYGDRFRPDFVLLTLCVNDFGDVPAAMEGKGDWVETKYWLDRIYQWCRTREILCVTSPIPYDHQVMSIRRAGGYPGRVSDVAGGSSLNYVFPIEDLVDEFLKARIDAMRSGASMSENPLYNSRIGDQHFSPLGADVWSRRLSERIALLLEWRRREKPQARHRGV